MPIYEYRCDSCQHIFEELQSYNDPAPDACPKCADASVRRLISNTSFQLKGDGWFAPENKPTTTPKSPSTTEVASAPGDSSGAATPPSAAPAAVESAAPTTNSTKIDA